MSTVKECDCRSVALALASIRMYILNAVFENVYIQTFTYVHVPVQRSSWFREYRLAREERNKTDLDRA